MKQKIIILLILSVLFASCVGVDSFAKPEVLTKTEFTNDWRAFTGILTSYHPGLTAWHSREEVSSFLKQQESRIDGSMDYRSFYALINETIDYIGDGHTGAYHSDWYYQDVPASSFPLTLAVIDQKLYLLDQEEGIPYGSEITAIDGKSSDEILNDLSIYTFSDGTAAPGETEQLNGAFGDYYSEHYGSKNQYKIGWQYDETGEKGNTLVRSIVYTDETIGRDYYPQDEEQEIQSYEYRVLDETTAYLGIHSFVFGEEGYTGDEKDWADFLQSAFTQLKEDNRDELILDLRENGGGDPLYLAQLLSYLIPQSMVLDRSMYAVTQEVPFKDLILPSQQDRAREVEEELKELTVLNSKNQYEYQWEEADLVKIEPQNDLLFKGKLMVLISPMTFSAGSMCAAILEDRTAAVTIGQETTGGMTRLCAAADFQYRLPNTGILLDIPTVGLHVNLKNKYPRGRGVIPDIPVENRSELYFAGKDPELETALALQL